MTPVHPVSTAGRAERLCLAAAAAALVFVATAFLKVPIPLGYAHLGDAVIFLAALLLPRREAALAAALGSALADFLGGFPLWMGPTLLIKCVMVYIVCAAAGTDRRLLSRRAVLGWDPVLPVDGRGLYGVRRAPVREPRRGPLLAAGASRGRRGQHRRRLRRGAPPAGTPGIILANASSRPGRGVLLWKKAGVSEKARRKKSPRGAGRERDKGTA